MDRLLILYPTNIVAHGSSRVDSNNDTALELESQRCGAMLDLDLIVRRIFIGDTSQKVDGLYMKSVRDEVNNGRESQMRVYAC